MMRKMMMVLEKHRVESSLLFDDAEMMMMLGRSRVESPLSAAITTTLFPCSEIDDGAREVSRTIDTFLS